jgi:hypothetical protein
MPHDVRHPREGEDPRKQASIITVRYRINLLVIEALPAPGAL